MKKVFLYAYDRQNLGDDLFVHTITKRYPNVQFYMWSDKINQTVFQCLPNLKVLDQESRFVRFLKKLRPSLLARYRAWLERRCDAVVYIGGSIFMEYDSWKQILTWWEYEAENRPFYVLGANFGPYHTEAYREKCGDIFSKMQDVCFRDAYSKELFSQVPTVRQASDILFSYPMPQVPVKEKQLFVSVIDCASRDDSHGLKSLDSRYVNGMAELLKGYMNQGYTPILCSFCRHEGDELGIQKIRNLLGPSVKTLCYDGTNAAAIINALAASELVIGTRFHATILALAAGRPVLPIIYSDKTLHVLQDLGFEGVTYDIRRADTWNAVPGAAMDVSKTNGDLHFTKLDEVLK